MDPPDPFTGRPSPTRRSAELQGPRPAPLKVNKDSHKIKKPPIPPQSHHHLFHQPPLPPPYAAAPQSHNHNHNPQPVIIYSVSPKVIHTTVSDFMNLVQSLTGSTTSQTSGGGAAPSSGDISPAARFASIENSSPSHRERERLSFHSSSAVAATTAAVSAAAAYNIEHSSPSERERERISFYSSTAGAAFSGAGAGEDEISRILDESNYFSVGSNNYFPGILSPAPATMPPASPPGLFSPASNMNMFTLSPSTLFSAPMVSPSPSSSYPFNSSFFDF